VLDTRKQTRDALRKNFGMEVQVEENKRLRSSYWSLKNIFQGKNLLGLAIKKVIKKAHSVCQPFKLLFMLSSISCQK